MDRLFAVIKIVSLCLLWYAAPGSPVILPVICMILASIAAEFSIVFNDSMMPRLTNPQNVGRISNLAWGLGYLGGMVVLIAVVTLLAANPKTGLTLVGITPLFGLDPASGQDARITGPIAALWYLIFILPMFLLTPDSNKGLPFGAAIHSGVKDDTSRASSPPHAATVSDRAHAVSGWREWRRNLGRRIRGGNVRVGDN